jgi:hypothetical protein
VLGSKANSRHAGPLTPCGNHIPVLFRQPALCGHPWHCVGVVREGRCKLHDTLQPTLVPPPRRTPRKRTVEPRKGYGRLPCARSRRRRDVVPVEHVPSVTSGLVRPCPPLWCHPRHCSTIPALWKPGTMRHCHTRCCASSGLLSAEPSSQRTDDNQTGSSHTTTLEAAPGQIQTRHDARWEQDSPGQPSTPRHYAPCRHT